MHAPVRWKVSHVQGYIRDAINAAIKKGYWEIVLLQMRQFKWEWSPDRVIPLVVSAVPSRIGDIIIFFIIVPE